jgi:hypothetical protein
MENMTGRSFDSISKRVVYNYACRIPEHRPVESDLASRSSQKQMYDFICGFFSALYNDPALLGMSSGPDECESCPLPGKDYLETRKLMRSDMKKMDDILSLIQFIGEKSEIKDSRMIIDKDLAKLNKNKLNSLALFSFMSETNGNKISLWNTRYPDMLNGLKLLSVTASKNEKEQAGIFSHCLFDTVYDFGQEIYSKLTNDKATFNKVIEYVNSHGFKLTTTKNKSIDVHYSKFFENEVEINFLLSYDERHFDQINYVFVSNKNTYKYFLNRFNSLDDRIQDLFIKTTNQCRTCGFCNQRNRNLPLSFIKCTYREKPIHFCYYFQFIRSNYLDEKTVDDILHFFNYVEEILS